ncbi:MAG: alpha/beta hydrolase [Acidimicrobiales bacterium]
MTPASLRRIGAAAVLLLAAAACTGSRDEPSSDAAAPSSAAPGPSRPAAEDGPATSAPASPPAAAEPPLAEWTDCDRGFECATISVPLDYADANRGTIELALVRLPARQASRRIGSLLVNPGGPGASGVEFVRDNSAVFSGLLRDRFDLVGFDPRGVGRSAAVDCVDTELYEDEPGFAPADEPAVTARTLELTAQYVAGCQARSGRVLPFVGTMNAARDLDRIRAAVGDERLTYLGFSYGTALGAAYAAMHPERVRALALDGADALGKTDAEVAEAQFRAFEAAFDAFAADCAQRRTCPLRAEGADAAFAAVDARLRRGRPLPVSDQPGRKVVREELYLATIAAMYSEETWSSLATGLAEAQQGDGRILQRLADLYLQRRDDGTYPNLFEANTAIGCADNAERMSTEEALRRGRAFGAQLEHFGPVADTMLLGCVGWPAAREPLEARPYRGPAPLLVVGGTGDPATPYQWAVDMTELLQPATLVTRNGEGHISYVASRCAAQKIDSYLVDLIVPTAVTC